MIAGRIQKLRELLRAQIHLLIGSEPTDDHDKAGDELWMWREKVFYAIFLTSVVMVAFPYLPTLIASVKTGIWVPALAYSIAYLLIVVLIFARSLPFKLRAILGLMLIYSAGLYTINLAGLLGSGRIYLFFFSIMACVLLGLRYGLLALLLNVLTMSFFIFFGENKKAGWDYLFNSIGHRDAWTITTGTFILLNSVAIISLALLLKGLDISLQKARILQTTLEKERAQLRLSNRELTWEIEERRRAEQALRQSQEHLRALMESATSFAVYRLTRDDEAPSHVRVIFVSPSIKDIVGTETPMDFDSWLQGLHPDDRLHINATNLQALETGRFEETLRIFHPVLREWRWIKAISTATPGERGAQPFANGIIIDITNQKRAEAELITYQERLRRMGTELLLTEERERRRIAVDLHDHIGQALAISKIKLKTLQKSTGDQIIKSDLDSLLELTEEMIRETRSLTLELSPPILYELGLEAAVEWLAEEIQDKHGLQTFFEHDHRPKAVDGDIRVFLFRAVRELLMNVVKHAQASQASITMRSTADSLRITVQDDGLGFRPEEAGSHSGVFSGFGLFSIRERLEPLGGALEIVSEPDAGTSATLIAPLHKEDGI